MHSSKSLTSTTTAIFISSASIIWAFKKCTASKLILKWTGCKFQVLQELGHFELTRKHRSSNQALECQSQSSSFHSPSLYSCNFAEKEAILNSLTLHCYTKLLLFVTVLSLKVSMLLSLKEIFGHGSAIALTALVSTKKYPGCSDIRCCRKLWQTGKVWNF